MINMKYLISVIIPVFNGERYLHECFDSIINQTLGIENIEVIVVDDSSTDNSVEIIKQYVEKYKSFKLIQQTPNQGSGPARNLGLKHVTSDYVTYLDCDDCISSNAYEKALEIFNKDCEVDMVLYRWEEFNENGLLNWDTVPKKFLKEHKIITDINEYPEVIFATYVYIKVYAKRLFPYLEFPSRSFQDNLSSARVMINSNKIYVSEDICCYYRQRKDSVSHEVSGENYLNLLKSSKQVIDLRDESSDEYYDILSFLALRLTYHVIAYICNRIDFSLKEGEIVYPILKEYPNYFSKDILQKFQLNFPNYLPCSEQCLWDLGKMDYYEYVIKNRCQKKFNQLKSQNNDLLNKNKRLKKKLFKLNKINKEILNSRSWKLTSFLRKFMSIFR